MTLVESHAHDPAERDGSRETRENNGCDGGHGHRAILLLQLLNVRRTAVAAGAAIVFLADVLEQAERLPVGAQRELEVLRERLRENLWVVDRDLIKQLIAGPRQAFDDVKLFAGADSLVWGGAFLG